MGPKKKAHGRKARSKSKETQSHAEEAASSSGEGRGDESSFSSKQRLSASGRVSQIAEDRDMPRRGSFSKDMVYISGALSDQ